MISNQLHLAIQELGHLSETARAVASRLSEGMPTLSTSATAPAADAPVAELQAQVAELQKLVDNLRSIIDDEDLPDANVTDQQASEFIDNLTASFGNAHPSVLARMYQKVYFKNVPRNIRVLMATALTNYASKTEDFVVPDIWGTLLANSGYLPK